jgi:hypothetical protein
MKTFRLFYQIGSRVTWQYIAARSLEEARETWEAATSDSSKFINIYEVN